MLIEKYCCTNYQLCWIKHLKAFLIQFLLPWLVGIQTSMFNLFAVVKLDGSFVHLKKKQDDQIIVHNNQADFKGKQRSESRKNIWGQGSEIKVIWLKTCFYFDVYEMCVMCIFIYVFNCVVHQVICKPKKLLIYKWMHRIYFHIFLTFPFGGRRKVFAKINLLC